MGEDDGYTHIDHGFDPVFDERSTTLVLGSFPSVLSRANSFYYGNPQNRFWRVVAACLDVEVPPNEGALLSDACGRRLGAEPGAPTSLEQSIDAKRAMLLDGGIALWDVVASCDIKGSSDASIRGVEPVDIARVLTVSPIDRVICNGGCAGKLYKRYLRDVAGIDAQVLPSTSPANAAWRLDRLIERWSEEIHPVRRVC